VVPVAAAPKIKARWDMDLSPAMRARPRSGALAREALNLAAADVSFILSLSRFLAKASRRANKPALSLDLKLSFHKAKNERFTF
jgi:hypothetical protein